MADVVIRALRNGPYEVKGHVEVTDFEGGRYPGSDDPIYLCRCGRSGNKPFCDGTHKKVGFEAVECVRMKQNA